MPVPIDFVLRANTGAFTRGVAAAETRLQGLKKSLGSFGAGGLAGAIGVSAVVTGFLSAAKNAQALRDELEAAGKAVDSATRSAAELGDAFDSAKGAVSRFAVAALGRVAEVGAGIRRALQGVTREQEEAARKQARDTARDLVETQRRVAAGQRKYEQERDPERILEAEKKLGELRRENAMRASDAEGQLVLLLARKLELEKERDGLAEKTVSRLEKEAEILKAAQAIEEQRGTVAKEAAEAKEREAEAAEKLAALRTRRNELMGQRDQILKDQATARGDRYLPSIEELAARADQVEQARANYGVGSSGSLVSALDPNDPALIAKQALEMEEKAKAAALSADPVQRLQFAPQFSADAEALRGQLSGAVQSRDVDFRRDFEAALEPVMQELKEANKSLAGKFKNQ